MPDEWLLYLRKSKGYAGITRQRTSTADHLSRRGGVAVMEFPEADATAYRNPLAPLPPRPKFDAMLAEMARRPGVGIAAWHADRLGRDPETTEVLIRACMTGGHLITTARGGDYDLSQANSRLRLRNDINAAAGEVDHNVERMLEAKAEAAALGLWLGGKRPFGWRPLGDGQLGPDDVEAPLIAKGSLDVLAGVPVRAITREWNAAGVTGTGGGRLTPVAVRKILLHARNAGLVEHLGQIARPSGEMPAIVGEDTWRAVRAMLSDPGRRAHTGTAAAHLLTGIALCGGCGVPVSAGKSERGDGRYNCARVARQLPPHPGPHASRSAAGVDGYIAGLAVARLRRKDAALLARADHREERKTLIGRRTGIEARKDEQWRLYKAGVIDDLELADGRRGIRDELAAVQARLDGLDQADALAPFLRDPEGAWDRATLDLRRGLVASLMLVTILPGAHRGRRAGFKVGERHFDPGLIDVRWVRPLPSDG